MKIKNVERRGVVIRYLSVLLLGFLFYSHLSYGQNKGSTMLRQWFKTKECASLEIRKYRSISDHQLIRSVKVEDSAAVKKIMDRIESIDPNGEIMKSFGGGAEHMDLTFQCEKGNVETIEIYEHHFKTPSTGFNDENKVESSLYSDIDALLFPAPGKQILKIKQLTLKFKDFSLVYLGETKSDRAPLSVSFTHDHFLIKDNRGGEQIVDITSGQLPPKPYDFDAGSNAYTLLMYQSGSKQRLYPDYFIIVKRK